MFFNKKDKRKEAELKRYSKETSWQQLPKIHGYWSNRYLAPKFQEVFATKNIVEFYANGLTAGRDKNQKIKILSIGSGLCVIEQKIANKILEFGYENFEIECLEMSPDRCNSARKRISESDVAGLISVTEIDINSWEPHETYLAVMANHSLHHFTALEHIFKCVDKCMDDDGQFVINDMIGKNGHQRWPEVLMYLEKIWETLPKEYKFNHPFNRFDDQYDDWDYSQRTCEGIRAQDILPLLCKFFSANRFVAEGGLIDVFVDRKYGHNFKIESNGDKLLIDQIGFMNTMLIEAGAIKPTMMLAWFKKKNKENSSPVCYRHWTPEFCMRIP